MLHRRGRPARQRAEDRSAARRSTIACNRCRSRKTRCCGDPPLPCPSCADAGQTCVYSEAEKRVSVPESYLRQLQSQSRTARSSAGDPLSAVPTSSQQPAGSPDITDQSSLERDDWWYDGTGNLFLNEFGEHHSVGPSSATHLARRLNPTSASLGFDARPLYDDPSSLRRHVSPALPRLPPYDFAKRLFWAQYAYIGTIFSLIQPDDFVERLDCVYNHPLDASNRESRLVYCQTLLVIGFGLMYSVNQWSGDGGPPGFKYFKHALRFLPDIHEEGSILFVEVLCYVAYFMQNLNRADAAFLYIGLALRMAISLGLHQEVSGSGVSDVDRDRRRRAWWSVYSLDRLLSVKSGNPVTIQDEDISTAWPMPADESTSAPWPSVVLTHYTKLSRILGRIGEDIYRKKPRSGSNLLLSIQSITDGLADWLRHVPERLRIDFASLDTHVNRESVSTFLHFYSCVNMTSRPLVFYVIQRRLDAESRGLATEDWRYGLSQNTVAMIDSCITAARATTVIMDAAAKHNLLATYGYLDGEYLFSAALLLVMVNAVLPHNDANARSMETALNLLRGMADRGNTYLGCRHALLLELQSAIVSRSSTETDVASDAPVSPGGLPANKPPALAPTEMPADWPLQEVPPPVPDISFNFDINDDPGLWEGVLGQIDIDMDADWIESALRR